MYPIYFLCLAVVFAIGQVMLLKTPATTSLLLSLLACNVGLQGCYAFMGHFFRFDDVARGIGWPTGSPFQKEIAFSNLSTGILGILCIWLRGDFWLATIVARSVFLWGAGYIHARDLKTRMNKGIFNAGPVLYFDLLFPFVLIGLYAADTMR
ncbi:MAG: hypothetical protein MUP71_06480 [Candidatus Aminicenantes bacterium]|nr:hypothetical protein [Candidatus Aminicenantes bacterium]